MEPMEDIPMNPVLYRREVDRLERELAKERSRNAGRTPTKRKTATRKRTASKTAQATSRPKKALPAYRMPGEQPRDNLGRFARKTGAVLWAGAKATGRALVGTAKFAKRTHKKIKQVNAASRRRANLEARERRIALAEREKKLGRKKVRRRKR